MGGTYTRERTKARSPAKLRASRGRKGHSASRTARTGRPDPTTAKQPAGKGESAARARSGLSLSGTSRLRSLRRRRSVCQSSSQGIGPGTQETGGSGPLLFEPGHGKRARGRGLGDDDEIDSLRQDGRRFSKELAKNTFRSVARDGIAEFACHRNPEASRTIVRARAQKNDGARQRHAGPGLLNADELGALANPALLGKRLSGAVLQGPPRSKVLRRGICPLPRPATTSCRWTRSAASDPYVGGWRALWLHPGSSCGRENRACAGDAYCEAGRCASWLGALARREQGAGSNHTRRFSSRRDLAPSLELRAPACAAPSAQRREIAYLHCG
jgi:hypothetical protein